METIIAAGLVNWIATLIIVEGVIFDDARRWVTRRADRAGWWKLSYLVTCHLCAGTWVGFALALVVRGPLPGGFIVNGLAYKAVGHITLEVTALLKRL